MNNIMLIQELSDAESERLMELFSECIAKALNDFKAETGIHISGYGGAVGDLYAEARQIVLKHRK